MIRLRLPYPPSVNHYWRHAQGRHYISAEGLACRQAVYARAIEAGVRTPDLRRLRMRITLTMPDKRRRDLDNALKALLDALAYARVYHDDEQIDELTISRGLVRKPGAAVVDIEALAANRFEKVSGFQALGDH